MKFLILKPSPLSIRILLGRKYSPQDPEELICMENFKIIFYTKSIYFHPYNLQLVVYNSGYHNCCSELRVESQYLSSGIRGVQTRNPFRKF